MGAGHGFGYYRSEDNPKQMFVFAGVERRAITACLITLSCQTTAAQTNSANAWHSPVDRTGPLEATVGLTP